MDLLLAFNARGVRYLIVGGYAVGVYSEPRATKDLDVFVASTEENSLLVFMGLADFGAPLDDLKPTDFRDQRSVFQMGQPPLRIDILQSLSAVEFERAWESKQYATVNGSFEVPLISADLLIENKLAAGRLRDLADVQAIRRRRQLIAKYFPEDVPDKS